MYAIEHGAGTLQGVEHLEGRVKEYHSERAFPIAGELWNSESISLDDLTAWSKGKAFDVASQNCKAGGAQVDEDGSSCSAAQSLEPKGADPAEKIQHVPVHKNTVQRRENRLPDLIQERTDRIVLGGMQPPPSCFACDDSHLRHATPSRVAVPISLLNKSARQRQAQMQAPEGRRPEACLGKHSRSPR